MTSTLRQLCHHFDLGSLYQAEPMEGGLIQSTWRVVAEQGSFVAQRLHPIFAAGVTEDGAAISARLQAHGIPTPHFLRTQTGDLHWTEGPHLWRVMTYLPGHSFSQAPDLGYLKAAGEVVAQMHAALQNWDYTFRFGIPHFHDTPHIWGQLQTLADALNGYPETDWLLETLPSLFLPTDLPHQIIHGDLKLTNFLFDHQGQVTGLLDLDTCMRHSLYVEMGDALRSWGAEGETFNRAKLDAALQGYRDPLDPNLIRQGIGLITLELATRFLIDVAEDSYWHWDPSRYPSRQEHNLARCRRQIRLFENLQQQPWDPSL